MPASSVPSGAVPVTGAGPHATGTVVCGGDGDAGEVPSRGAGGEIPWAGRRRAMATVEECEAAMHRLADRMQGMDADAKRKTMVDRSVTCHLRDLAVTFGAQLRDGALQDIHR